MAQKTSQSGQVSQTVTNKGRKVNVIIGRLRNIDDNLLLEILIFILELSLDLVELNHNIIFLNFEMKKYNIPFRILKYGSKKGKSKVEIVRAVIEKEFNF